MADYQITCITPDGADADRRIDHVGGPEFYDSVDNVIGFIRRGEHRFWTVASARSVWVIVKQHPSGRYYLTTEGDGFPPNNLLKLPRCS